jgi:asparaginyl-tRNA synthetase
MFEEIGGALKKAEQEDSELASYVGIELEHPKLNPEKYYLNVAEDPYFKFLSILRHHIHAVSNSYFSDVVKARHMDLFLMTSSVSSPSGPGSDSVPIALTFGGHDTYLTDSSQFGFEPILIGGVPRAYCYLASMRGEEPDKRHLNQFYHCEYEAQGSFPEAQGVAEGYVRALASLIYVMPNLIKIISRDSAASMSAAKAVMDKDKFREITFAEAEDLLRKHGYVEDIKTSDHGKDITNQGEKHLLEILGGNTPVWLTELYRDRVPFYQKPLSSNPDLATTADLLSPSLIEDGFGGEMLGMGERQDSAEEMYESLKRQGVNPSPYEWYIDIRRLPKYKTTAGFGLGIERFISWILGFDSIHKAILYPRMKGDKMNP